MIYKADFDKHSHTYRETLKYSLRLFGGDDKLFDLLKISCIKRWVIRDNNAYDILDFGCGVGKLTGLLAKDFRRSRVVGYDISKESIAVAEEENAGLKNIHFINEFTNEQKYDFIIVANVFHHIDSKQRVDTLCTMKQLLKSGGKIVILEHNPFNPFTRYIVNICPFDIDVRLIWLRNFIKLANISNLRVELRSYVLFFPWQSGVFRTMERVLGRIPLGAQYMLILSK
ncbi:MAG: class I SAM-dependent methyltransferase [Sedimentisphaerales bacterium]